ncbi:MAG: hypothetical protein Q9165_008901 [Trypethelium subeluteriae]
MGCSKEKPTCARCHRRGEVCVYAPTRRVGWPGRKEQKRVPESEFSAVADVTITQNATSGAQSSSPPPPPPSVPSLPPLPPLTPSPAGTGSNHYEESAMINIDQLSESPSAYHSTGVITVPEPPDIFFSIESSPVRTIAEAILGDPMPLFPAPSSAVSTNLTTQVFSQDGTINFNSLNSGTAALDELLDVGGGTQGITLDLSCNDSVMYPSNLLPQANGTIPSRHSNWFACSGDESNLNAAALASTDRRRPAECATNSKQSLSGSGRHSLKAHSCVSRALVLLNQLMPHTDSCVRNSDGLTSPNEQPPSFQDILAQNEAGVDSVSQMLDCPCSEHFILLHILSLIMSKFLGWYAAASVSSLGCVPGAAIDMLDNASSSSLSSSSSASVDRRVNYVVQPPSALSLASYIDDVDDQDKGRIVCQVVLSKLHNTQRVVNLLSRRLLESDKQKCPSEAASNRLASIAQDLISGGGVMSHQASASGDNLVMLFN